MSLLESGIVSGGIDSARVQRNLDRFPRHYGDLLGEYLEAIPRDFAFLHNTGAGDDVFLMEVRDDLLNLPRDGLLRCGDLDNPLGVAKEDKTDASEDPDVVHPARKVDFLPDPAFQLVRRKELVH